MPFEFTIAGTAVDEVILGGTPLTSLEAMLYFGFADLAKRVTRLRQQKHWDVQTRQVPLADVLARIEATLGAPVPVHAFVKARMTEEKLHVTEYWHDAEAHAAAH